MTIQELLAAEKSEENYDDPEMYKVYEDPDGLAVIYHSRPITLVVDGEEIDIKKMKVKIADFGKGILRRYMVELTAANFIDDDERESGDRTVLAPEVLLGSNWDCMADVWSLGISVPSILFQL